MIELKVNNAAAPHAAEQPGSENSKEFVEVVTREEFIDADASAEEVSNGPVAVESSNGIAGEKLSDTEQQAPAQFIAHESADVEASSVSKGASNRAAAAEVSNGPRAEESSNGIAGEKVSDTEQQAPAEVITCESVDIEVSFAGEDVSNGRGSAEEANANTGEKSSNAEQQDPVEVIARESVEAEVASAGEASCNVDEPSFESSKDTVEVVTRGPVDSAGQELSNGRVGKAFSDGSAASPTAVSSRLLLLDLDADGRVVAVRKGEADPCELPANFAHCSNEEVSALCAKLDIFLIEAEPAKDRQNSFPSYFQRWAGVGVAPLCERFSAPVLVWSVIGSFAGILLLCAFHYGIFLQFTDDISGIVGSFGAQAVLLYAAPGAALAQPYNSIVGNAVGCFVGVSCYKLVGKSTNTTDTLLGEDGMDWLAGPLAVSLAILAMHLTKSLHPPAGAMALIAVVGSDRVKFGGYWLMLVPGVLASVLQVLVALLINNISCHRVRWYPQYWQPVRCK